MSQMKFQIANYDCPACGKLVQATVGKIAGVVKVEVDNQGGVILEADREIDRKEIVAALQGVGKQVSFG